MGADRRQGGPRAAPTTAARRGARGAIVSGGGEQLIGRFVTLTIREIVTACRDRMVFGTACRRDGEIFRAQNMWIGTVLGKRSCSDQRKGKVTPGFPGVGFQGTTPLRKNAAFNASDLPMLSLLSGWLTPRLGLPRPEFFVVL